MLPSLHFDGRVITSDEIERIHKEVLKLERIEAVSDPMRELIEDLWPELVHKLPRRRGRRDKQNVRFRGSPYMGRCIFPIISDANDPLQSRSAAVSCRAECAILSVGSMGGIGQ